MSKKMLNEIFASLVVFLVALPLCMGIAVASGVSPEKGLVSGIIGGLIVSLIAGCPLQVTGPAAGLIVISADIFKEYGIVGLGLSVFLCGLLQILSGRIGLAQWFRAVCPSVIKGMLSGIGIIIVASQFHILIDETPKSSTLINLLTIPEGIINVIKNFTLHPSHTIAALIGIVTILSIVFWDKLKPKSLKSVPGALVGIVLASFIAHFFSAPVKYITLPENLLLSIGNLPWLDSDYSKLLNLRFLLVSFALGLVASAEALLCAVAVDKLDTQTKTDYDKELVAQGVGNVFCGIFAALPITGVIVRSSANMAAGAKTKWSAFFQGLWLLVFVIFCPQLLELIPTCSLAALLTIIGFKLINPGQLKEIKESSKNEYWTFIITVLAIVSSDLLTGIIVGFLTAMFLLLTKLTKLDIQVLNEEEGVYSFNLAGSATFLKLPLIAKELNKIPDDATLHVHLKELDYIDKACLELLISWQDKHAALGSKVYIEWDALHHYNDDLKANFNNVVNSK